MTMERSKSTTYGQACTLCYKAKCRCVRAADDDDCERCIRLGKRCERSGSIRNRNAQTNSADVSDTRIARLEDKMESLLSAMQYFIGSPGGTGSSINIPQLPSLGRGSHSPVTSFSNGALITPATTNPGFSETFAYSTHTSATALPNQADERLNFFRSRMLPSFPFIHLTPDITSGYLRRYRPFLFQAIQTVTIFSTQERLAQSEDLKRLLFTSALIKVESNIDLLLGLLTYLAWSTDAFLGRADLVSRLMMLAISLVYDLQLFKPSSPDVQLMMNITQGRPDENDHNTDGGTTESLFERQRAVLACFFLSSNISSHLGRQDALRWTPQMEESLRIVAINQTCAADELFVAQVRLQVMKQKAEDIRQHDETNHPRTSTASTASAPRLLYLKTLRRQLHELRALIRADLQHIDILNIQAQYVELYINQLAYSITQDAPLDLTGQRSDGGILLGFERLDCLWRSVENIKSWLNNFYTVPCSKLVGQPFHFWSQMILSITLLKYLSTLQDPDWDCHAVRNTVNLISTMDRMLLKLDLGSKEPELQCNDHLLKLLSKLLSKCRVWAQAQWNISPQMEFPDTGPCQSDGHHGRIPDLDQMAWMQSMDLGNDQWLQEVLGMRTTFY